MKFGVLIALVGLATAARLEQMSVILKDEAEDKPADSPMPPSGDEKPTESQLKLIVVGTLVAMRDM